MRKTRRVPAKALAIGSAALLLVFIGLATWPHAFADPPERDQPAVLKPASGAITGPAGYPLWTAPIPLAVNWTQSVAPAVAVDKAGRVHVVWKDGQWGAGVPAYYGWTIYHT